MSGTLSSEIPEAWPLTKNQGTLVSDSVPLSPTLNR